MNEIIEKINTAKHIVVVAHVNPDADSLGSASAMYTYLLQKHKKVSFFCKTKKLNQKFAFLPWFEKIRPSFPSSAELAISFDCGAYSRLAIEIECDLINIDHHQSNEKFGDISLIDSKAISTTEVVYDFFKSNTIKINKKMATALYAGLLDDSDGFMSSQVDGTTFAMSKELIECGADYKVCNNFIMQYQTLAGLRLKAIMLSEMQLHSSGEIALFLVSDEKMKQSGAYGADCESALEEALHLPTVQVSLLLKENSDFNIKGSLRAKDGINILEIASAFKGGGHQSRAGFTLDKSNNLIDASNKIIKMIQEEIQLGKK